MLAPPPARPRGVRWPVALLVLVGTLRCGAGEPDNEVILYGQATLVDGTPISDAGVALTRSEDAHCPSSARETLKVFDPFLTAQTDSSGNYLFDFWLFQTWSASSPNETRCFRLQVDGDNGSLARFQAGGNSVNSQAPTLQLWTSAPSLASADGGVIFSSPDLLSAPLDTGVGDDGGVGTFAGGTSSFYDWVVVQGDAIVWHVQDTGQPLFVDAPLVEDFAASGQPVCAASEAILVPGEVQNGAPLSDARFRGIARSSAACVATGTLVPASRGKPCMLNGQPLAALGGCLPDGGVCTATCPLTDGILSINALMPAGTPPPAGGEDTIDLDLQQTVVPATVIVRGLDWTGSEVPSGTGRGGPPGPPPTPARPASVLGSVDAQTWIPLGQIAPLGLSAATLDYAALAGPYADYRIDLPESTPAIRYLRLASGVGQGFFSAKEVSVFGR